ncbi:MAG: ComEC/Rec2 family competence protein [Candidatus Moraniibacteriota bacterium]
MKNRKLIYFILGGLALISLIFFGLIFQARNQKLSVAFLDVGQGDAILISQGSKQVLIDGGASGQKLMEKLGEQIPFWDREIEVVIATHPDADHIGGLVEVLRNYTVDHAIESGAKSDSQVFGAYEKIIEDKKTSKLLAVRGMKIKISDEIELEVLSPNGENMENLKDTNSASVVTRLSFGENSFLFTGDLPLDVEAQMLKKNLFSSTKVLKVSHHGSKSATSIEFLNKVNPEQAVISVGKNNRYGHPTSEVLERLGVKNIAIFRTDILGDVIYNCGKIKNKCVLENA